MFYLLSFFLLVGVVASLPALPSKYDPTSTQCPSTPLLRAANGISTAESAYINARKTTASAALKQWLLKQNENFKTDKLPTVALTTSGGGLRSLLTGGGFIQALDSRDSSAGTSGLLQGLTYQAGLSGGAWLLSSFAGNNYPTISSLKDKLWKGAFSNSILVPDNGIDTAAALALVANDLLAKEQAKFPPTLVDPYGRLLSYELLSNALSNDGDVSLTMSSISRLSSFSSHTVAYPIITAIGLDPSKGCTPPLNSPIYEFSPFEFGSFDQGISAFTPTQYLGTALSNGTPKDPKKCTQNYDNLGLILGTSSDLFFELCEPATPTTSSSPSTSSVFATAASALTSLLSHAHNPSLPADLFASYPNPFLNSPSSPLVSSSPSLSLIDGGATHQNNPLFPLLQPSRAIDLILVNDNSADTPDNFPDGSELHQTYLRAQAVGLTRMPAVPDNATFVSQGLNKRPVFFGCHDPSKVTLVYMPNRQITYDSGQDTLKLEYSSAETDAMVANGNAVATNGGDEAWPMCLACAVAESSGADGSGMPDECAACLEKYCWTEGN
ncbi:MAG: hypothetical protein Q9227_003510 [Pyrenula ochraceoflavens]